MSEVHRASVVIVTNALKDRDVIRGRGCCENPVTCRDARPAQRAPRHRQGRIAIDRAIELAFAASNPQRPVIRRTTRCPINLERRGIRECSASSAN